jgi:urease accessory protein
VVRAFPQADGAVLLHLHNISGGVLGGDHLEMEVELGRDARAQLTTTGSTRLYRLPPSMPEAVQINQVTVREDGWLEYLPDPLIPFAGAGYRQVTTIALDSGAGLFWWEIVAPGREARGEIFDYERLELKIEIHAPDRVIASERNRLEPRLRPLDSPARLGHYRYFASFYICRVGLEARRWLTIEEELREIAGRLSRPAEILWGISALPAHGLLVRALSISGRAINPGLIAFWRTAKLKLYGLEAVSPRKIW